MSEIKEVNGRPEIVICGRDKSELAELRGIVAEINQIPVYKIREWNQGNGGAEMSFPGQNAEREKLCRAMTLAVFSGLALKRVARLLAYHDYRSFWRFFRNKTGWSLAGLLSSYRGGGGNKTP